LFQGTFETPHTTSALLAPGGEKRCEAFVICETQANCRIHAILNLAITDYGATVEQGSFDRCHNNPIDNGGVLFR
jgi:hypothetical protein